MRLFIYYGVVYGGVTPEENRRRTIWLERRDCMYFIILDTGSHNFSTYSLHIEVQNSSLLLYVDQKFDSL